jgi:hypothetical protein
MILFISCTAAMLLANSLTPAPYTKPMDAIKQTAIELIFRAAGWYVELRTPRVKRQPDTEAAIAWGAALVQVAMNKGAR